jgi:hypothetical protein
MVTTRAHIVLLVETLSILLHVSLKTRNLDRINRTLPPPGIPPLRKHQSFHTCSLIRSSFQWNGNVVPSQSKHGQTFFNASKRRSP